MIIYFIEAVGTGLIKIGKTKNVAARLRSLQTSNPHRLQVIKTISSDTLSEQELHRLFANQRMRGEWFVKDAELLTFINSTRDEGEPPADSMNSDETGWRMGRDYLFVHRLIAEGKLPAFLDAKGKYHVTKTALTEYLAKVRDDYEERMRGVEKATA